VRRSQSEKRAIPDRLHRDWGYISLGLAAVQIILDKGQREDWFSSNFIRAFFALMLVGIIAGILWELREKETGGGFTNVEGPQFCGCDHRNVFPGGS